MLVELRVIAGPDQGRSFQLIDGRTVVVGRGQEGINLSDPYVSRTHCIVEVDQGRPILTDRGSASGTLVNGTPITQQELMPGDIIQLGKTQLRMHLDIGPTKSTLIDPPQAAGLSQPLGTPESPAMLPVPRAAYEPPRSLLGSNLSSYHLQRVLTEGPTGTIFIALDTKKNVKVAVKVLRPELAQNPDDSKRFVRAMKTMIAIRHPNIVELYAAGRKDPYCWLAMEYVEGESLAQVIDRIGTAGRLDWRTAFRAAVDITRALEAACEHHIVHRNITPRNILVRRSDKVTKLGDLMLSKALEGPLALQVTRAGQLVGDVLYMAPERTRSFASCDSRSDIYSLGAAMYAVLTGRPPFEGSSLSETVAKIRNEPPADPKKYQLSVSDRFSDVVLKMLEKRPEDRYPTPGHLMADLEKIAMYENLKI